MRRISATSGTPGAGRLGDGCPQVRETDLGASVRGRACAGERGAPEVRLDTSHRTAEAGFDRPGERAVGADEDTARDEELGHVDVERRLRRAQRRCRQVDEHRPVLADEHVAQAEPAERSPPVEAVNLPQQVDERLVAHLVDSRELKRLDVGLARATTSASPS
jgi:hypothetical protein